MKKYIAVILGLVLACNPNIQAQGVTKTGTTAASFLGIDVGPRANAMGSASVSLTNDVSAMYWNPAGIARINNVDAMFCNARWIADLQFNYAGIAVPLGSFGNVGVSATFLTMDQMERTTINQPEGTGEMFDAASYAFGLTYARNLTDQFSLGISAKYINERLYNSSASGFALDVGALFDTRFHGIMLGMSISNYGSKMQLDGRNMQIQHDIDPGANGNNPNINARLQTDNFDLPLLFRIGISVDVLKGGLNSNLIISADALHPSDDVESLNIGAEYTFNELVSLRIGYKDLGAIDTEQGLNYGAGIHYVFAGTTLNLDYAYINFGDLNAVNMFSVRLGF
jgi:hypothetical protein